MGYFMSNRSLPTGLLWLCVPLAQTLALHQLQRTHTGRRALLPKYLVGSSPSMGRRGVPMAPSVHARKCACIQCVIHTVVH